MATDPLSPPGDEERRTRQHRALVDWLRDTWRHRTSCPLCGENDWSVSGDVFELREFRGGALALRSQVIPVCPITCVTCGYTCLVSAVAAGVVSRLDDEPDEPERPDDESDRPERRQTDDAADDPADDGRVDADARLDRRAVDERELDAILEGAVEDGFAGTKPGPTGVVEDAPPEPAGGAEPERTA